MFFYKIINAFHADAHNGNFLFHKIKPGGYIHYNIYGVDYYLKNLGFMFVIWDFGLIKPFYNSNIINNNKYGYFNNDFERITYDFETVINAFKNKNAGGWVDNKYPISTNITNIINDLYTLLHSYITYDVLKLPELNTALLKYLTTNISSLSTRRPSNVINTNPYVLN
jgi:predicted unusual protein kinase regulating ubiquinone biosynthesis (AarF/ABC1/UbiB family)